MIASRQGRACWWHSRQRRSTVKIGGFVAARRRHQVASVALLMLIGLVAWAASASASSKPTLVVYSAQGYDKAMVAAFQKATGIPTKLDDNSTGPLLTQIEASKNNPNWGLLWVD